MFSKLTLIAMLSCMALAAPGKDYGAAVASQEGAASHGSFYGGNTGLGAGAGGDHGSLKGLAYSHVSVYRPKTHTVPIYYHHHHVQENHGHKSHSANQATAAVLGAHQGNELNEGYALQGYTHQVEAAPAPSYSTGHEANYVAAPGAGYGAQANYGTGEVSYAGYSEGTGHAEANYPVNTGAETSGQQEHYGVAERSGYEQQYIPVGHAGQGENVYVNHGLFRPNVQPQYHY